MKQHPHNKASCITVAKISANTHELTLQESYFFTGFDMGFFVGFLVGFIVGFIVGFAVPVGVVGAADEPTQLNPSLATENNSLYPNL